MMIARKGGVDERSLEAREHRREFGGITILVSLFLLMLLTISAMSMSKNSLREVMISGTTRQGIEVRNIADSGLDWAISWMAESSRPAPEDDSNALELRKSVLELASNTERQGIPQPLKATPGKEMTISSANGITKRFDLSITAMGQLELQGTQKNPQKTLDAFNPATLQLWSVRSDASADYTGQVFLHSREAWLTLLPKQQ